VPTEADDAAPVSPQGSVPEPFTYNLSQDTAAQLDGGTVKMADTRNFKASKTIAMAEVTVEPGHMRELHWHPTQDEWSFFLEGEGRVTLFAAQGNSRTFTYQAGDIGKDLISYSSHVFANASFSIKRLCSHCYGTLRREHRYHHPQVPRDLQSSPRRRYLSEPGPWPIFLSHSSPTMLIQPLYSGSL
jgi:uncharacterized cupin superfamily protein